MTAFHDCKDLIINEVSNALGSIDESQVAEFAEAIMSAKQVFCVGVGRVLISLEAFVKRLNHLGIKAFVVGALDEPAITSEDLLIVGSGSGASAVPVAIARIAKKYNAKIAHVGSNPKGPVAEFTDLMVRIPVKTKLNLEDEIESRQIMSSLFEQSLYLFCDCVCLMIAREKKIDIPSLWRLHANLE